jgi:hypothetical protein
VKGLAERREELSQLIDLHNEIFVLLRTPAAMQPDQIDTFQLTCDIFCRLFVDMFGRTDITNYIHNLMAGHFRFMLRR